MAKNSLIKKSSDALDNLAAVWAEIDRLQPDVLAVKPVGSFTIDEYVKRYGVPRRTAEGRLDSATKQGNLSRVKVCLPDKSGRMTGQWCYSLVKKT